MGLGIWGMSVYSVLVKRRPTELDGLALMLVVAALGTLMILPFYVAESLLVRAPHVSLGSLAGILYIAVFPSIGSYFCWNAGVAALGANRAGFTIHLLPAFATVLAMLFLGEEVRPFHIVGIATIIVGVGLATRAPRP